jgi:hypothetical protein
MKLSDDDDDDDLDVERMIMMMMMARMSILECFFLFSDCMRMRTTVRMMMMMMFESVQGMNIFEQYYDYYYYNIVAIMHERIDDGNVDNETTCDTDESKR